jgi:hypothetical protein
VGCGTKTNTEYVQVTAPASAYLIEYLPGMMSPAVGMSSFRLRVRSRSDSSPATGLAIALEPVMHMSSMSHGAPVEPVVESATPGTYDCAAYYLMASGAGMGYWELKVKIGEETTLFYPSVGMAMGGDTQRQTLYGPADAGMAGAAASKYYLFRRGPVTAAGPTLNLFVTHSENMMMSFKPASVGAVLAAPTGAVSAMALTADTDPTFSTPVTGTDGGQGHWSLDLAGHGLAAGTGTTVYVKLRINGEDKTMDGAAPAGANAYSAFVVTPQ